jgi:hypothetical protein
VTSTCDPAAADILAAQVYNNLTSIIPTLAFDVEFDGSYGSQTITDDMLLDVPGLALPTACPEYFSKERILSSPSMSGGARDSRNFLPALAAALSAVIGVMLFV